MTTAPITIDPPFLLLNSAAMIQLILLHLGWLHFSTKYSFWAALSRWWRRRIVILSPLSRTFTFAFQENIHLEPQLLPDCDSIATLENFHFRFPRKYSSRTSTAAGLWFYQHSLEKNLRTLHLAAFSNSRLLPQQEESQHYDCIFIFLLLFENTSVDIFQGG